MKTALYYLRWALFFPLVVLMLPYLLLLAVGLEVDRWLWIGKWGQGLAAVSMIVWHLRPKR
jgi:hypothetical protein